MVQFCFCFDVSFVTVNVFLSRAGDVCFASTRYMHYSSCSRSSHQEDFDLSFLYVQLIDFAGSTNAWIERSQSPDRDFKFELTPDLSSSENGDTKSDETNESSDNSTNDTQQPEPTENPEEKQSRELNDDAGIATVQDAADSSDATKTENSIGSVTLSAASTQTSAGAVERLLIHVYNLA